MIRTLVLTIVAAIAMAATVGALTKDASNDGPVPSIQLDSGRSDDALTDLEPVDLEDDGDAGDGDKKGDEGRDGGRPAAAAPESRVAQTSPGTPALSAQTNIASKPAAAAKPAAKSKPAAAPKPATTPKPVVTPKPVETPKPTPDPPVYDPGDSYSGDSVDSLDSST
jgi:translation initiation factor IF-3